MAGDAADDLNQLNQQVNKKADLNQYLNNLKPEELRTIYKEMLGLQQEGRTYTLDHFRAKSVVNENGQKSDTILFTDVYGESHRYDVTNKLAADAAKEHPTVGGGKEERSSNADTKDMVDEATGGSLRAVPKKPKP